MSTPVALSFIRTRYTLSPETLFQCVSATLRFELLFTYGLSVESDGPRDLEVVLKVRDDTNAYHKHRVDGTEVRHIDYGRAILKGSVEFVVPQSMMSTFILEIAPPGQPSVSLCLGRHRHPLDEPLDLLKAWIEREALLRLPRGWTMVPVSDGFITNIVASPAPILVASGTPGTFNYRATSQELLVRIAALTAIKLRLFSPNPHVCLDPARDAPEVSASAYQRWSSGANTVADVLKTSHGVHLVADQAPHDDVIGLAFYQTLEFTSWVNEAGGRGVAIFGWDDPATDITAVVDLHCLQDIPSYWLRQVRNTDGRIHKLDGALKSLETRDRSPSQPAAVPPSWRDNAKNLCERVSAATHKGMFLNSEPRIVGYWIDLAQLGLEVTSELTSDAPAAGGLPKRSFVDDALHVAQAIVSRTGDGSRAAIIGVQPSDLGTYLFAQVKLSVEGERDPVLVGNMYFEQGEPRVEANLEQLLREDGPCRVVLLIVIDTYTAELDQAISWLHERKHAVVGVVPLVSATETRPHGAHAWEADYFPLVRVHDGTCDSNPRLRREMR